MSFFSKKSASALIALILCSFSFSHLSFADHFEVEPYVGYGFLGNLTSPTTKITDTYSGLAVGARGMFKFAEMFFAGPDFTYMPSLSYTPGTNGEVLIGSPSMIRLGILAGVKLPFIRAWIGYNFIDDYSLSDTIAKIDYSVFATGSSFKVGVGYEIIPFLSLNAELIANTYSNAKLTALGLSSSSTTNLPSGKLFMISLSSPIPL